MKIGVLAFVASYTAHPVSVARKCEALGFESFWLPEHAIMPVNPKTPFPRGDGKIPEVYSHMIDPFVGLALAASATNRIKLGTGICLVPERDPFNLAKEVATLDYYSGGRVLFGIGAGWPAGGEGVLGRRFPPPLADDPRVYPRDEGNVDAGRSELRRGICEVSGASQ